MRKNRTRPKPGDPWALTLRMLSRRDYSRHELRQRLADREVDEEAIDAIVERCQHFGYLDDARYACNRARSLMREGRAVGARVLRDLRQRGIPEELARQALAEAEEEFDQERLLQDLLEKRVPGFDYAAASARERRRIVHFLQRRGFSLERIMTQLTGKG